MPCLCNYAISKLAVFLAELLQLHQADVLVMTDVTVKIGLLP